MTVHSCLERAEPVQRGQQTGATLGGPHGLLGCPDGQLPDRPIRVDGVLIRLGRRLASVVAFALPLPLGEADGVEGDGELEYEQSDELPTVSAERLYRAADDEGPAGMLIDDDMLVLGGEREREAVRTSPQQGEADGRGKKREAKEMSVNDAADEGESARTFVPRE